MEPGQSAAILTYPWGFVRQLSAAAATWIRGDDVRARRGQLADWRVGWPWWAIPLALTIVAAGIITAGVFAHGDPVDIGRVRPSPIMVAGLFVFTLVLSSRLNEGPGWRGFTPGAGQRAVRRAPGVLPCRRGVAVWHLPYFLPARPT